MAWWEKRYNALTGSNEQVSTEGKWWSDRYTQALQVEEQRKKDEEERRKREAEQRKREEEESRKIAEEERIAKENRNIFKKIGKIGDKIRGLDRKLVDKLPENVKEQGLLGALFPQESPEYKADEEKQKKMEEEVKSMKPPKSEKMSDDQYAIVVGKAQEALIEDEKKIDELTYKVALAQKEASGKIGYAFTPNGINDDPEVMKLKDELVMVRKDSDNLRKFLNESGDTNVGSLASSLGQGLFHTVIDDTIYGSQAGTPIPTTFNPFRDLYESTEMARYSTIEEKFRNGEKLSPEETALYNLKMNESRIALVKDVTKNDIAQSIGEGIYGSIEYVTMILASGTGMKPYKGIVDGIVKSSIAATQQAGTIFLPKIVADAQMYLLPEAVPNNENVTGWEDLIKYEKSGDTVFSATAKSLAVNWSSFFIENVLGVLIEGASSALGTTKKNLVKVLQEKGTSTTGNKAIYKSLASLLDKPNELIAQSFVWKFVNKMLGEGKPISEIAKALRKTGVNGLPTEVLEEEVTELVTALVEGRKYELPFTSDEATDRFFQEIAVITPLIGISAISESVADRRLKFLEDNPDIKSFGDNPQVMADLENAGIGGTVEEEEKPEEQVGRTQEEVEKDIKTVIETNLENQGIESNETTRAVENVKYYMQQPPTNDSTRYMTNETVETLRGTGVDEINFDSDDTVTLYRDGDITEGNVNSFSLEQKTDKQIAYKVPKEAVAVNLSSKAMEDLYQEVYGDIGDGTQLEALQGYGKLEAEVLVVPTKEAPVTKIKKVKETKSESKTDTFLVPEYDNKNANASTYADIRDLLIEADKAGYVLAKINGITIPINTAVGLYHSKAISSSGVTSKKEKEAPVTKVETERKRDTYRESILPEYNNNTDIEKLDALVDEIRELDPEDDLDAIYIKTGAKYEVRVSYPHSLGENGNTTTYTYKNKPTIEDIKKDLLETYKEQKIKINEPLVAGIVAKSGRDENIEKAIDKVSVPSDIDNLIEQALILGKESVGKGYTVNGQDTELQDLISQVQPKGKVLTEEARMLNAAWYYGKYKDVSDYISNAPLETAENPKYLYRGIGGNNAQAQMLVDGTHMAETPTVASDFASRTKGLPNISVMKLSSRAKIADLDNVKEYLSVTKTIGDSKTITKALVDSGYDGAVGTLPAKGKEYIIINNKITSDMGILREDVADFYKKEQSGEEVKPKPITKTAQKKAESEKKSKTVYEQFDEMNSKSVDDLIQQYKDNHAYHSETGLEYWLETNLTDDDKIKEVIDKWLETEANLSKEESGIIESNEKEEPTTNKDTGRDDRPRQPTDTVRVGDNEQGNLDETAGINSESVARRVGEVSDTGSGIRPTARITAEGKQLLDDIINQLSESQVNEAKADWFDNYSADYYKRSSGDGEINTGQQELIDEFSNKWLKRESTTELENTVDELPEEIQKQAEEDWLENFADDEAKRVSDVAEINEKLKNKKLEKNKEATLIRTREGIINKSIAVEEAFINKWRNKEVEHNKPIEVSKKDQVEINKQIEELIKKKGVKGKWTAEEKDLLRQYTGSGGLEQGGADGRGLLDEYYTPKPIVDFIVDKIKSIEYTSKNIKDRVITYSEVSHMSILEPAAGIGRFLDNRLSGLYTAYEINKTSSDILRVLNPDVRVFNDSFESNFISYRGEKNTVRPEYNIVIGNPPYGEHRGTYLGLGEEPKIVKYEEYFIKRGLDLLYDEGILAYVVPSSFLRSSTDYAKSEIAKIGYLVDAYRLPNGVFGTTSIGTDVIFVRKRPIEGDTNTSQVRLRQHDREVYMSNDTFFDGNPDKILGKVSKGTGNYGADEVKGTLEDAIKMAGETPVEVSDDVPADDIVENEKVMDDEITETEEATKIEEAPPVKRVPENPVVTNEINKKAQIIPNKKDTTMKLSDVSPEQVKMWSAVNVTGELNSSYASFDPKTFVSKDIAVEIVDGETKYYPNVLYYQGNIYEKLDNLTLFKDKISDEQYNIQKKGLEAVLPVPKKVDEIQIQPNSDFVKDLKVNENGIDVKIITLFRDFLNGLPWEAFSGSSSWEVEGYIQGSIVNTGDKVYNIAVRTRRREAANSLFKRFLVENLNERQKSYIEDRYNRQFNAYHKPDYSAVPVLSEINSNFNPKKKAGKHPLVVKQVQKEGASFLATKGVGLLGYDVGVGKTMTSIIALNDVMKKGWAKKPLVVVPNGVYRNWINEISEIMPNVKINSLMNLGAAFKGDLKTLEIEDGTLSIITYEGLSKLGFTDETYAELTDNLKDVMAGVNNTKRGKAKQDAKIEENIGRAMKGTTTERFFEELGFDHITIDEVQNFKNIFAGAKVEKGNGNEYRNVRGSTSARGIKAYLMAQYILSKNNNRNVFLLSATPFTNSPLEIYSILSLMGKKRLEQIGLKNVNDFMSMYMEIRPTFVVKADQTVKEEDVIEKFQNLQELQKLVTEFIDFRTGEEAGVERPDRIKKTVELHPTELQNEYVKEAQNLFNDRAGGGAIVAITELQNITLSPYLSRYNKTVPTYKEFVENSPKIKFAVEAVAQVRKDNKETGQVIYMPRGVDHFNLVKEYLIKEKGFKPSEIGEVTGGMKIDKKQEVQDKFNAGDIKVLLGTEAIKEGVNLQERSTDLYHLHLPWNPTDMLQVEGRIWRQGNMWKNVRVHYPLIENSVDSFIFQKLETKEKRIKNLWSYKENEVNVGDLDFENMKLDLITDPVIRVKAEETFERKKQDQEISKLKVEKAFMDRTIEKLVESKQTLKWAEESLQEAQDKAKKDPESYEAGNLDYYIKKASKAKAEVTAQRNALDKMNIDVKDIENKSDELGKKIEEVKKEADALVDKYQKLLEKAKEEKVVMKAEPNNYFVLTKEIANEDATFFVKRAGQDKVLEMRTTYKTPSGTADIGGYADIQTAEESVSNIKSVEFPELLRIVKDLTGNTPTLKRFRNALGMFYAKGNGMMKFHPDIWKEPKLATKVIAHELGHLSDFLPDKTLMRGNIIGRIASLNKYLKGRFGEPEINNADIRAELKELSQKWKPFEELDNPNFTAYRYSSKELYADAISVLFNDPTLLKTEAPLFYEAFFQYLDEKPEVAKVFHETWDVLNEGEEAVFNKRNKEINEAYKKAEQVWATKTLEKNKRKVNIFETLRTLFDDKNYQLNKRVNEQVRSGVKVEDALNPMYSYEGLNYLDGKIKNFVADNFQPAYKKAAEVDGGWETLGKVLQMERVINERGDLANPFGYDPKTAQDFLTGLENNTDQADWIKIQEAKNLFRKGMEAVVNLAEKNGYYKPAMIEQMKANPAYATYQVIDYLDTYISASIKHQAGTLKEIANPATSSVMKAIATMKAIENNNAKKSAIDFERDFNKDEIEPAKRVWTGKSWQVVDSKDPDKGTVVIIRNGTPEGYYVDKELAEVFNRTHSSTIMMGAKISRLLTGSKIYRGIFTQINLGFQTFNIARDFFRYWKNIPDYTLKRALTSLPRAVKRYGQAIPHAYRATMNQPDALIKEMENKGILGLTFNDMFQNSEDINETQQIERIMQKAGVTKESKKRGLLTPFYWLFDQTTNIGDIIEKTPKIAGYIDLKGLMPEKELASFIRNYVGSPNFRTSGTLTPISNNILLFSNAYKEGIKSDMKIATNYKTSTGYKTRGGFWWKTMLRTILPKALMLGATLGFGGDELRKLLEGASEYDKTNYDIIPLGFDENGKTIYLRIPQDETGRFLGGLFWKLSKVIGSDEKVALNELFQVIDFGAGQIPNLVPSIEGIGSMVTYLSGRNPYDTFRGRNVLTDDEFNAGTKYSFPIFMDWWLKQQGLGIVMPTYTPKGEMTTLESIVYAPVVSNILGRWLKVSDYGKTERLKAIGQKEVTESAARRQDEKKLLESAVKEYYKSSKTDEDKLRISNQLIKDVVGEPPYNTTDKTKATNIRKKFSISILKKTADPNLQSLIYATTNSQKVAILKELKKEMSFTEFSKLKKIARDEKIISDNVLKELK